MVLKDQGVAALQRSNLALIVVHADHGVTNLRKANGRDQTDIA